MSRSDARKHIADLLANALVPTVLKKVYPLPPQSPPQDSVLPAAYPRSSDGETNYSSSQRVILYTFEIVALVARTPETGGILPNAWKAAEDLEVPIMEMFEKNMSLGGRPEYYDARYLRGVVEPVAYLDAQYMALIVTASVKEKKAVEMTA